MKRVFLFLVGVVILSGFFGCEKGTTEKLTSDSIDTIRYGTSFGECMGYCIRDITITESEINFEKRGWGMNGMLPEVSSSKNINSADWAALIEKVDFDSFILLDSVIGCPDCADGGAEYIEIVKGNQNHKVVFEFMNVPNELGEIIDSLRNRMQMFADEN